MESPDEAGGLADSPVKAEFRVRLRHWQCKAENEQFSWAEAAEDQLVCKYLRVGMGRRCPKARDWPVKATWDQAEYRRQYSETYSL